MLPFGAGTEFYFCGLFLQPSLLGTRAGDRPLHDPIPSPQSPSQNPSTAGGRGGLWGSPRLSPLRYLCTLMNFPFN